MIQSAGNSIGGLGSAPQALSQPPIPPSTPATPAPTEKENAPPPSQVQKPHSSAFSSFSSIGSSENSEKHESSSPATPGHKPTFEDKLIGVQWYVPALILKIAADLFKSKTWFRGLKNNVLKASHSSTSMRIARDGRTQLLAKFTASLWMPEQYHQEHAKLDNQFASPKKQWVLTSPEWDLEKLDRDFGGSVDFENFDFDFDSMPSHSDSQFI
ncbi:hypothetical protein J3R30DRAFT_3703795 [Lentinula aciculospora]|uniref:Uncharacterized protein n=1 Tax=Lentinula aciculospora TaxID=153920 RepID=A0A9W9A929_9AGAR|nr:hypothetical protein J3R30DRAFT_3703795 [Lentinula aciculospora]